MKATEIRLEKQDYTFSANTYSPRSHYKLSMELGRVFPTTRTQAMHFVKNGLSMDVLNSKDVEIIEAMLNKYGLEGRYEYTKSKSWVRLQNSSDLDKALKLEFAL